jgi:predicted RNA binding protein YcfA (HicA-like mRNA interferase family)
VRVHRVQLDQGDAGHGVKLPKELAALLAPYCAAGYEVGATRGNHVIVRDPRGRRVLVTSGTPSDHRALLNARGQLRRATRT